MTRPGAPCISMAMCADGGSLRSLYFTLIKPCTHGTIVACLSVAHGHTPHSMLHMRTGTLINHGRTKQMYWYTSSPGPWQVEPRARPRLKTRRRRSLQTFSTGTARVRSRRVRVGSGCHLGATVPQSSMEAHRWPRRWRAAGRGKRAGRAAGRVGGRAAAAARRRPRSRRVKLPGRVEPRQEGPRVARRARGRRRQALRARGGPPPLEGQPLGGGSGRRPGPLGC